MSILGDILSKILGTTKAVAGEIAGGGKVDVTAVLDKAEAFRLDKHLDENALPNTARPKCSASASDHLGRDASTTSGEGRNASENPSRPTGGVPTRTNPFAPENSCIISSAI